MRLLVEPKAAAHYNNHINHIIHTNGGSLHWNDSARAGREEFLGLGHAWRPRADRYPEGGKR